MIQLADYHELMGDDDMKQAKSLGLDPAAEGSYVIGYHHGYAAGMRYAHEMFMKNLRSVTNEI